MKRRFIIGVSGMNPADENLFINFLRDQKVGYWHWIDNFWLVVDTQDRLGAAQISNKLHTLKSPQNAVVFQIPEDITWQGFGPNKPPKDMFEWLKDPSCWHGD